MTMRDEIVSEARSWIGTPWHHMGDENALAIKGVGVDCAILLVDVCKACGLVPQDLNPRPYSMSHNIHRGEEVFLGWLSKYGEEIEKPTAGDLVVWKYGRVFSHGAFVIDDDENIIHAYRDAGIVTLGSLLETQIKYEKNGQLRPCKFFKLRGID